MPKIGMEPIRRAEIIHAAIREIGRAGSLDVTVRQIADRAGVSSALAHHYFGNKDGIFLAAFRSILDEFGRAVRTRLAAARTPDERLDAILGASFDPEQFSDEIVSAWLVFYVQAHHVPEAARLLRIYARRLDSNLRHAIRAMLPGAPRTRAAELAEGAAAMIDGFYIRHALRPAPADGAAARARVRDYVRMAARELAG
ncbi:transcriptional regulator BetI [Oceanicella actignis]|uniref:transcriptional regulator BetI n=1 Tax=Oceanicella actignis TaxID=1189325 RepID=UPI0011E61602|nr:transcriptional regulator BetI [Oceanicella actignis]TYO90582.1 TetR family transcriptional regulator [Oceanicella actignis]